MYINDISVYLYANYSVIIILCCNRPEADDVRAMQDQLSSLHLVMEQNAVEHEKKLKQLEQENIIIKNEKTR